MNEYKMGKINKKNEVELMKFDKSVTSKVIQILADYVSKNVIRYLNVSVYNNLQKHFAPVASKVMHSSNKRDLSGLSGSNPGWGASAFSFTFGLNNFIGRSAKGGHWEVVK